MLKVGSRAAERYESRQVRKEAAVNSSLRVPRECLVGVIWRQQGSGRDRRWVHDPCLSSLPLLGGIQCPRNQALRNSSHEKQRYIHAKKSLGQHFLVDEAVLRHIVSAAELTSDDKVVEVGPGLGILTRELARKARRVIAVEVDGKLASVLAHVASDFPNVEIVGADILKLDLARMLSPVDMVGKPLRYKVVANLPYYITSSVLHRFLEAVQKPACMVVMVQKEVGEEIVARAGRMSLLAAEVQFHGKPTIVRYVSAQSFYPPPKVDSVILRIDLYSRPPVDVSDAAGFLRVVRAGFGLPRKQLRNSLACGLGIQPQDVATLLERAGVNSWRRAETLELVDWARICETLADYQYN